MLWLHALVATIAAVAGGLITGLLATFVALPLGKRSTTFLLKLQAYFVRHHRATDVHTGSAAFTNPAGMYELAVQNPCSASQLCVSKAEPDGPPLPSASSARSIAHSTQSTYEVYTCPVVVELSQQSDAQAASAATSSHEASSMLGTGAASTRKQIIAQTAKGIWESVARMTSPSALSKGKQTASISEQTSVAVIIEQQGTDVTKSGPADSVQMPATEPYIGHVASVLTLTGENFTNEIEPAAQTSTDEVHGHGMYSMVRQHSQSSSAPLHNMLREQSPEASFSMGNMCRTLSQVELGALFVVEPIALVEPGVVAQPMSAWNKVRAYLS